MQLLATLFAHYESSLSDWWACSSSPIVSTFPCPRNKAASTGLNLTCEVGRKIRATSMFSTRVQFTQPTTSRVISHSALLHVCFAVLCACRCRDFRSVGLPSAVGNCGDGPVSDSAWSCLHAFAIGSGRRRFVRTIVWGTIFLMSVVFCAQWEERHSKGRDLYC